MLKLRKLLLQDKLYIVLIIIVLLLTLIRISIPHKSVYKEDTKKVVGRIISIKGKDTITYELQAKEKILIRTNQKTNNFNLGDKVEVIGTLEKPSNNTTNYLFNYKEYLKHKHIYYIVFSNFIKKISNNKNI